MFFGGEVAWRGETIGGVETEYSNGNPQTYYLQTAPATYHGFMAHQGDTGNGGQLCLPYCNNAGVPYANDNVGYSYGFDHSGTGALRRYTTLESPLWRIGTLNDYRASVSIGDAAMRELIWFFTNSLNEDYGVAIDHNLGNGNIWFTANNGAAWTLDQNETLPDAGVLLPTYLYMAPADPLSVFFVGTGSIATAAPCYTDDFGTTFYDLSRYGTAFALDTILGLVTGDADFSEIIVDPYCVSGSGTNTAEGIDVSHWQGLMDWTIAASAGVGFAFIKCTDGTGYTDSQFAVNWAGALAAGIDRGAYHFFRNNQDPLVQANHFLAVYAAAGAGELNMALDCEEDTPCDPANIKIFLDRIETVLGYHATIYTAKWWWNAARLGGAVAWASAYPLWVASYAATPTLPSDWATATYQQYSDSGVGSAFGASSATIHLDKVL
jgi:hypothetical protein